jgi:phosphoserine phosphatase
MERRKAVIFDLDGVLAEHPSGWRMVHEYFGLEENTKDLAEYIKGKIDDKEFMRRTIAKWPAPLHISKIKEALCGFKIMPGAEETIRELKKNGFIIGIASCGFDILANKVAKDLGINLNYVLAEGLEIDEKGNLTGEGISRVDFLRKDKALISLSEKIRVSLKRITVVGDSEHDIPMLQAAGLGIAFNPADEKVRKAADVVVEGKNLCKILKYIL